LEKRSQISGEIDIVEDSVGLNFSSRILLYIKEV
jgi:hypothetical protein